MVGFSNRQSFYAAVSNDANDLNAVVTIDMNGLKEQRRNTERGPVFIE